MPARQAWNQGPGRSSPGVSSPLHVASRPQDAADPIPHGPPAAASGGNYYEDIDPRFAEPSPTAPQAPQALQAAPANYDDQYLAPGARSPTISERSGFTSVSQRGINPNWNPPPGQGGMSARRPVNRNDVGMNIINSNPDFQIPGRKPIGSANSARGGPGGLVPDSAYPGI